MMPLTYSDPGPDPVCSCWQIVVKIVHIFPAYMYKDKKVNMWMGQ